VSATEQLQAPFLFSSTSPSASIDDLLDATWNFDPEMHEHFSGSSRFPMFTIGNDNTTISIKTTDNQAHSKFIKGMQVTDATIKFKVPVTAVDLGISGPTLTQDTKIYGFKISNCRVVDPVKVGNNADKKPGEFDLMFRAARVVSTGADPTITFLTS
jgi:hypothetical protein